MSLDELNCRSCGSSHIIRSAEGSDVFNRTKSRWVGGEHMRSGRKCADCGSDDVVEGEPDLSRIDPQYLDDEEEAEPTADMDSLAAIAEKYS